MRATAKFQASTAHRRPLTYKERGVHMKKIAISISLFLLLTVSLANAYDLATEISNANGKVTLSSIGYAKVGLIKVETSAYAP